MAYMLKNRQLQIPGGIFFYQPQTKWKSSPGSFENVVQQMQIHRRANAWLNLTTDTDALRDELDAFAALVCARNGWTEYIIEPGGGMVPKSKAPSAADLLHVNAAAGRVKKIWSGVRTLNDWIDSKEDAVSSEISESRAKACAECPTNGQGDFSRWFTQPAAQIIKKQVERLADRKLSTPYDEKLNICEACLCPLKLKVHTPFHFVKEHLREDVLTELKRQPHCWIVRELSQ